MNLRWSWDDQTRDLFRGSTPTRGTRSVHDPVRRARRRAAASGSTRWSTTPASCASSARCATSTSATSTATAGSRPASGSPLRSVAYFSPEFGIAEALPQYSGGLGVLAGDHLKAASDLGVPLVGIGLFYRHGYFRQSLSADGWQQERYPDLDPHAMALTPCDGVTVEVDLAGAPLVARVWQADVGRVPLYLLDADVEENAARPARRSPTASTAATSSTASARRSSSASAACARSTRSAIDAAGVPHQRGPRRVPRARAHPPAREGRRASSYRRGDRGGARRRASSPPTRRCRPASTASPAS